MKDKLYIDNYGNRIYYTLLKTKRKTIGIIIDRNGEVRVHAPFRASKKQIYEVVQKRADWVERIVNEIKARNSKLICRQFVGGEKILYLGREYTLEILEKDSGKPEVLVREDTVSVCISPGLPGEDRKQAVKEALTKWYRQRFSEIVNERVEKYSLQLKAAPCKVAIKDQKTMWGSCSKKGNINLNWKLVMAPVEIIDYVIVHELCHLKVMSHSKEFWNLVASVLPNCEKSRKWLKANGYMLAI
jgi:predicted metal-dependent hydrolase